MSRRDYNRLADAFRLAMHQTRGTLGSYSTLRVAADLVAGELKEDNPRFDRARFLTACGFVEPESQSGRIRA